MPCRCCLRRELLEEILLPMRNKRQLLEQPHADGNLSGLYLWFYRKARPGGTTRGSTSHPVRQRSLQSQWHASSSWPWCLSRDLRRCLCSSGTSGASDPPFPSYGRRNDVRENRIHVAFFQMMLPVTVGVDGVAVLFAPLPDGQTAFGLFFAKDSPLVGLACCNFLVVFMRTS